MIFIVLERAYKDLLSLVNPLIANWREMRTVHSSSTSSLTDDTMTKWAVVSSQCDGHHMKSMQWGDMCWHMTWDERWTHDMRWKVLTHDTRWKVLTRYMRWEVLTHDMRWRDDYMMTCHERRQCNLVRILFYSPHLVPTNMGQPSSHHVTISGLF